MPSHRLRHLTTELCLATTGVCCFLGCAAAIGENNSGGKFRGLDCQRARFAVPDPQRRKVALSGAVDRLAKDLYELEGHFVYRACKCAYAKSGEIRRPPATSSGSSLSKMRMTTSTPRKCSLNSPCCCRPRTLARSWDLSTSGIRLFVRVPSMSAKHD